MSIGNSTIGRPGRDEAAAYYFGYIDRVPSGDVISELEAHLGTALAFLKGISEEHSLHRYAADKWSMRQVLNHVNDTERVFGFRAFWFARGLDGPLPSFDEGVSAKAAQADQLPWATHVEEFRAIRLASLGFFRSLPDAAWMRTGVASGNSFTVRALAYIVAGHVMHHLAILNERYL
jgi:hypothetical protein